MAVGIVHWSKAGVYGTGLLVVEIATVVVGWLGGLKIDIEVVWDLLSGHIAAVVGEVDVVLHTFHSSLLEVSVVRLAGLEASRMISDNVPQSKKCKKNSNQKGES